MVLSMDRWTGKVAIVTGVSSGIGVGIVKHLVDHGIKVVGLARRIELVHALAEELQDRKGKLYPFQADLTKEEDILKAFSWTTENLGPIHILVNNAGGGVTADLTDAETSSLKSVLDVNVFGLCIATREAIKVMKANSINGHIIHISSVAGHSVLNIPHMNIYPAAKHAVKALTETLRQELARDLSKIKVTEISPGAVMTEGVATMRENNAEFAKAFPDASFLEVEDIANGIIYVLSTPEHVQVHELMIKPIGEKF